MYETILQEIGLTKSEIKVYRALLEMGSSSKDPLVKKAKISSSKIYEVTDKLIEKGLVSYSLKNNVKYFSTASPNRIKDYLEEKKNKIIEQEKSFDAVLPELNRIHSSLKQEQDAEVFKGWKGLETVYDDIINNLGKGGTSYVIGASTGVDKEASRRFYKKIMRKTNQAGIKLKIIFNRDTYNNIKSSTSPKSHITSRYLNQTTPTEINIYGNNVAIISFQKNLWQ